MRWPHEELAEEVDDLGPEHLEPLSRESLRRCKIPERATAKSELRGLLERAINGLPTSYRLVYVLRELEGLSTAETATALQLGRW